MDRKIADKRVFPAIDIQKSGTRKEELAGRQRHIAENVGSAPYS